MSGIPARLVVVRLGAIGDVVNALCFATAIKRHAPRTEIGWAVHPLARPLVEGHPSVDRVHVWPRKSGVQGLRAVAAELRAARYELAVDLQRIAKSSLLARLSGAPRVLGYDRRRAKELSWLLTRERIPAGDPRAHMVDQYLEFARHLGVTEARAEHLLPADPGAERWADERIAAFENPPVLINIGASKPENRWAPERFGALAARITDELEHPAFLVGGPGDRERTTAVLRGAEGSAHDLVGATSLAQLAALAARSALVVSCDTGPMHVAVAAGATVVALFGPADPARTGPYGERHTVVRAADGHMNEIEVDAVFGTVRAKLAPR
ncbi:MAG: glycosyltransferase family 9 protein [bacterium]|nr:glycosyltransferase family 9 protein [bacterium]